MLVDIVQEEISYHLAQQQAAHIHRAAASPRRSAE